MLYILSQSFLLGEFVEKLKLELIMWRMQRAIVSGHGVLVEPFGTLTIDRQTQDLMIGRFLPAANALTSETLLARKPPKPEELGRRQRR
ncbi:unnamed protein product [Brassica oleracea var. botrytis]